MAIRGEHVIIIHYSEIGLKKGNRRYFEDKLSRNILESLADLSTGQLRIDYGRFLLFLNKESPLDEIVKRLRNVMGIAYFCIAYEGDWDITGLCDKILSRIRNVNFHSFCVRTRRTDKQFPLPSPEINRIVGAKIQSDLNKKVDLTNPELACNIEIYNKQVFFYFERIPGRRGLPVGGSGRVISLLSAGIDSPVASYLMMKRGCRILFVHFHNFPITNKASYHNAIRLAKKLTPFQLVTKIFLVPLIQIQENIILNAPVKLRLILYRRMMLRIAARIAQKNRCKALVTGESLGQVASQTLENIVAISEAVDLPILRPLIGMDKEEIIQLAKNIETFDISIEPFDDCCSYLVPENPETRAKPDQVHDAEKRLGDWQTLIDRALQDAEIVTLTFPEQTHVAAE
ncbi:MAG TPA: tRNA 4-thiouridine(8) synthase ThiI [bacterium]|nr:tRNA 4-thiouridine(8) synthase ThiI [bacterium]